MDVGVSAGQRERKKRKERKKIKERSLPQILSPT